MNNAPNVLAFEASTFVHVLRHRGRHARQNNARKRSSPKPPLKPHHSVSKWPWRWPMIEQILDSGDIQAITTMAAQLSSADRNHALEWAVDRPDDIILDHLLALWPRQDTTALLIEAAQERNIRRVAKLLPTSRVHVAVRTCLYNRHPAAADMILSNAPWDPEMVQGSLEHAKHREQDLPLTQVRWDAWALQRHLAGLGTEAAPLRRM